MELEVLGCSNAWSAPGAATSGYLVRDGEAAVLVDCGHGVLGKLRERIDPQQLDAVWLSHTHPDHCADLLAMAHCLRYHPHPRQGHRPVLFLPAGELDRLHALGGIWGWPDLFEKAFDCCEVGDGERVTVGGMQLRAAQVPHAVPTLAVDVRGNRGRFTYGADCGPNTALEELARNTPLLLVEATLPAADDDHLSPAAAGALAAAAGAEQCVLVHVCDAVDRDQWLAQACATFGGRVRLAVPGARFKLG